MKTLRDPVIITLKRTVADAVTIPMNMRNGSLEGRLGP